ncbi:MAG: hypothetical protein JSW37_12890 [Anaerolineales bacterium]|nr:MAG: hypothetical protein JSW37_12890 [Anaerolineales bacterium]
MPTVEAQLSNLQKREALLQHLVLAWACLGQIMGWAGAATCAVWKG